MGDMITFWVAFSYVPGVGSARISRLLDAFGDLECAWQADARELRTAGMGPKTIEAILRVRSSLNLDQAVRRLEQQGIDILPFVSDHYPERLLQIQGPPACLYLKGELLGIDQQAVAVVGTRRPSSYGKMITEHMVEELATMGLTIISGLARGIDGIAHRAALDADGRTLAILGSGIDLIYPSEHRKLAEEVSKQGALLSEYPPGTAPEGHHFPARNRIIAGLARAVVVVEAAERSGALITADFAADQGKDVFAVPGDINRKTSGGTNRLIQDGAHALLEAKDVIDVLHFSAEGREEELQADLPEDKVQLALLEYLEEEPAHIDELYQKTGLPIHEIQAALSLLELRGTIKTLGGMQYLRVREERISYCVD
jgi:DNA processing protein